MSARHSELMIRRWASPAWAARQREKIRAGLLASPLVAAAAKARCARKALPDEGRTPYDPLRDNPRMKKILGAT